ncbi:MAG: AMP-binding protein [Salibacteraceae bacterium]|nr:AMP-binding protein [Salibacteraceae bacterium]
MVELLDQTIDQDQQLSNETLLQSFNGDLKAFADKFQFRNTTKAQPMAIADIAAQVDACAKSFVAIGLDKGNKVGVYDATTSEWLVLYGAANKLGIELVHIGREYSSEETMLHLSKSKCRVLFASANAQIFLKDLIAKFTERKVVGLFTEFVVLLDADKSAGLNNVISYDAFKNLAKYTSDWELNKLKKFAAQ